MSEEQERETNRQAHSTRDQTKPNRVYEPVFQKEERRGHFSNRPQIGLFWARLSKSKIKGGLNTTYRS